MLVCIQPITSLCGLHLANYFPMIKLQENCSTSSYVLSHCNVPNNLRYLSAKTLICSYFALVSQSNIFMKAAINLVSTVLAWLLIVVSTVLAWLLIVVSTVLAWLLIVVSSVLAWLLIVVSTV